MQRVAVSGLFRSGHLPWRWAFSGKGAQQVCGADRGREVSRPGRLRHFSTTDTGKPNPSPFGGSSPQKPPFPGRPGPLLPVRHRPRLCSSLRSGLRAGRVGNPCRAAQRPHSPHREVSALLSTPPLRSRTRARGAEIFQLPERVREGSRFPPGAGLLSGLALRLRPPPSALAWPFLHCLLSPFAGERFLQTLYAPRKSQPIWTGVQGS